MPGSWERTGTDDAPVWKLEFEHRPGLVVRCTVPSLRARVVCARLSPALAEGRDRDGRALLAVAEVFAEDSLLSWNLTWNGAPRACTAAGIGRVDLGLVTEILAAWIEAWNPAPPPDPAALPTFPELDELALDLVDLTDPAPEPDVPAEADPELVMADA